MVFLLFAALLAIFTSQHTPGYLGAMLAPYICFFLFFLVWASRNPPRMIRFAAYRAPLVFLAFQIAYLGLEYYHGASMARDIVGLGGIIVIISTYVILLGYIYVFLMEQSYLSYLFYMRHHHLQQSSGRRKSAAKTGRTEQ